MKKHIKYVKLILQVHILFVWKLCRMVQIDYMNFKTKILLRSMDQSTLCILP